jgi:alanyl-tRNA synthetase
MLSHPDKPEWRNYSVEFCGGTHIQNTGEIGQFVITAEESVQKGVRRIVALTGAAALAAASQESAIAKQIEDARKAPEKEIPTLITTLQRQAGAEGVPLRAKRRVQAAVTELQAKL